MKLLELLTQGPRWHGWCLRRAVLFLEYHLAKRLTDLSSLGLSAPIGHPQLRCADFTAHERLLVSHGLVNLGNRPASRRCTEEDQTLSINPNLVAVEPYSIVCCHDRLPSVSKTPPAAAMAAQDARPSAVPICE